MAQRSRQAIAEQGVVIHQQQSETVERVQGGDSFVREIFHDAEDSAQPGYPAWASWHMAVRGGGVHHATQCVKGTVKPVCAALQINPPARRTA